MEDIGQTIESRVASEFALAHLEVVNESHRHNVPANSQTHFKLVLVSDDFTDVSRINRHRAINALVSDLLAGEVHALALHPYTVTEWRKRFGEAPLSPPCLGGEALDGEALDKKKEARRAGRADERQPLIS